MDIFSFDHEMYYYLVKYPAETILLLDQVVNNVYKEYFVPEEERETFDKVINVRMVDLMQKSNMR